MKNMKSFHVPLQPSLYEKLRSIAKQTNQPATELARDAIIEFIKEKEKRAVYDALVEFTNEYGGTELDSDTELQEAGLELLRKELL